MGNPVVQWQILAKEAGKAEAFYTSLFDWKVNANNALQYRRLETGSDRGIDGGSGRPGTAWCSSSLRSTTFRRMWRKLFGWAPPS
jgi:predicted enzyme related to lactoylglutathione lyase